MFKKWLIPLMALIFHGYQSMGQGQFKPSGSPYSKIFFNFHSDLEGESAAFEIQRAYLGYTYKMSEKLSGDINFDVGISNVKVNDSSEASTSLQMTAYLKTAALIYKSGNLQVDVGMIGLKQFKIQEKYWGYRYIEKSFQDLYGLGTSADLGASVEYKFSPIFSADFTVRNGEGYKKFQSDNHFNTGVGLTLSPLKGLTVRGFYDYIKKEEAQRTIAHFIGYQHSKFSAGIEYNTQLNYKNYKDRNINGYSVFGSYQLAEKWKFFGRYDDLGSNEINGETEPWNIEQDGNLIISGIEYAPIKNVQVALNYQGWMPEENILDNTNMVYLNFQYSF